MEKAANAEGAVDRLSCATAESRRKTGVRLRMIDSPSAERPKSTIRSLTPFGSALDF
jgi:hypothetical protein